MNKKSVLKGLILGIAAPLFLALLFVAGFAMYMHLDFGDGFRQLKWRGQLPNVLRIGLLANLAIFTFTVRKNELLSRGILLATLVLLTISLLL